MDRAIMWVMAVGALLGGLDRIFGNRFGLGERFEAGFHLLGPIALSMVGILCLEPLISRGLSATIAPAMGSIGLDPGMLGALISIDMGGYPLGLALAANPRVGLYAGLVAASIFGCTVSFTIPVSMGMVKGEARDDLARGILYGLIAMPLSLLLGGCLCGLPFPTVLVQTLPLILLAFLLILCLWRWPASAIRGFNAFAWLLKAVITLGLMLGAFQAITHVALLPGLAPIEEGMAVVSSIGVVLLGSLPMAELLQRALKKPFGWLGRHTGMNEAGIAGLLLAMISALATLALFPRMDRRSRVVNAACMVCTTATLAAHLGFTAGVQPDMLAPVLAAKLAGGLMCAALALFMTRNTERTV